MTKITGLMEADLLEAPDILVGGTPCQAFSVAGLRAGLSDQRGALTLEYVRIANAIDDARSLAGEEPCIAVWENVPGVLSSKDNAYGCFLAALAGEDDQLVPSGKKWTDAGCVYGPQRAVAWRVLDAQYFGLAQRRRRVFVVASARNGFDPAAVLFEREGVRRDTAPGRGQGEDLAGGAADGSGSRGNGRDIAPTLDATMDRKWGSNQWADNGFAIIEPVIMSSGQANAEIRADGGAPVLTCLHEAPIVVNGTQDPDVRYDQAHTLGRNSGQENAVFAIQAGALRINPASGPDGVGVQADHAYTLEARAEVQAVAYDFLGTPASEVAKETDIHTPLRARKPGQFENSTVTVAVQHAAVRRLTPRECERLQGFPDSWTAIPWRGKPASECPDGPRYKAIGNSKAVPVVRWIGRRIEDYLSGLFDDDPLI